MLCSLMRRGTMFSSSSCFSPTSSSTFMRSFSSRSPPFERAAVLTPSLEILESISRAYNLDLSSSELKEYREIIRTTLPSFTSISRMSSALPDAVKPKWPRVPGGSRPLSNDNPYRAWYWKFEIQGAKEGPLNGKRVGIKDNIAVAGIPMMNGSAALESYTPEYDATIVNRILDAGGMITGKTACEDLCFSGSSFTTHLGPILNPMDPSRSAGGSSGGSAAVVAAGDVPLAIAGDQGGSIRIPSSFCGTVGHKPTFGLVPYTGASSLEVTLDHLGPIGRNVEDVAQLLEVISGPDSLDPRQRVPSSSSSSSTSPIHRWDFTSKLDGNLQGIRIGVLKQGFNIPDISLPETDETVTRAIHKLKEAGAEVLSIDEPLHLDMGVPVWNGIGIEGALECMINRNSAPSNLPSADSNGRGYFSPTSMVDAYGRGLPTRGRDLSPTVKFTILLGDYLRKQYQGRFYSKATNLRATLTAAYDRHLNPSPPSEGSLRSVGPFVDALVMPTTPFPAPKLPKELLNSSSASESRGALSIPLLEYHVSALNMITNTAPFDVTGHPAITVDCRPTEKKLPVGLMIVGRHWEDETILRIAYAHEKLRKAR